MTLVKLIYVSCVAKPIGPRDISRILASSQLYNGAHAITGMLCHGGNRFIQYLEGEREAVNELYARIMADDRHKKLMLLEYRAIRQRLFKDWSMGFVGAESAVMKKVDRVGIMDGFNVEILTAEQSVVLIKKLKRHLAPQYVVVPQTKKLAPTKKRS